MQKCETEKESKKKQIKPLQTNKETEKTEENYRKQESKEK